MLSETHLLWVASDCQVGGSFGFTARLLADSIMEHDPLMMAFPADVMGSCAWRALDEILAGTEANSGELAKVQRFSTASRSGLVASLQRARFSGL